MQSILLKSSTPGLNEKKTILQGKIAISNVLQNAIKAASKPESDRCKTSDKEVVTKQIVARRFHVRDFFEGLLEILKKRSNNAEAFNRYSDKIKMKTDWQSHVGSCIKNLNEEDLKAVITIPVGKLRGFDREVMQIIRSEIIETINERKLETKLNKLQYYEDYKAIILHNKELKTLGGGAVNTVYEVKYEQGGEEVTGVFKPDIENLPLHIRIKEALFGAGKASGIPVGVKSYFTDRSVATSKVDLFLFGEKARISVKTEYAIVNGVRGMMMEKAIPNTPALKELISKPITIEKDSKLEEYVKYLNAKNELSTLDLNFIALMSNCREVSAKMKNGEWQFFGKFPQFDHFDPKNSTTAEAMLKMQILDYITGQVDRHPKNYFVDENGNLICIDNDLSFGVNSVPQGVDIRTQPPLAMFIPNNASLQLRPPPVITKALKKQIIEAYKNREELRKILAPNLSQEEIEATIERLANLYDLINHRITLVVDSKEELLSREAKLRMDSNNSYWARELLVYNPKKKSWNYLRAWRK